MKKDLTVIFTEILPPEQIKSDAASLDTYGKDWSKGLDPAPSLVLFPKSEEDVAQILKICSREKIEVVPSGGRTGLSGAATAIAGEVVVSFEKLNKIIEVDKTLRTLRAQSGVVTEKIQSVASEHGLFFPLDFASSGSCQIGGNVSTNAGGIKVIKYGGMKEWILGLRVVLASGEVLDLDKGLRKDRTGYNLKDLFIGAEGTLGLITQVTLKLTVPPQNAIRILGGVASFHNLKILLDRLRATDFDLSMFEFFPRNGLEKVIKHHNIKNPFSAFSELYFLVEIENCVSSDEDRLAEFFMSLCEEDILENVIVSQSQKQFDELLRYRELLPETLSTHYTPHKNDLAVPVNNIEVFLKDLETLAMKSYPEYETLFFGHLGDGNVHLNILKPDETSPEEFFSKCHEVDKFIYELACQHSGTISAEHGVGLLKKDYLHLRRSQIEIDIMKGIKKVFDPDNILNPGKIF